MSAEPTAPSTPTGPPLVGGGVGGSARQYELDGLRALACVAVFFVHTTLNRYEPLYATLDLFFIMAGFLTTRMVLPKHGTFPDFDRRLFFQRRLARLWPAMLFMFACTPIFIAMGVLKPLNTLVEAISALTFTYPIPLGLLRAFGTGFDAPDAFRFYHLHSLTQEVVFYVFWSGHVARVIRKRKPWTRTIKVCTVVVVLMNGFRVLAALLGNYAVGFWRPDFFLTGCLCAFFYEWWLREGAEKHPQYVAKLPLFTQLAIGGITVCAAIRIAAGAETRLGELAFTTLVALLPFLFLGAIMGKEDGLYRRFLRTKVLTWFSLRTYSFFLWHLLIMWTVDRSIVLDAGPEKNLITSEMSSWVRVPVNFVIILLISMFSWKFIEEPALKRSARRHREAVVRARLETAAGADIPPT